MPTHGPYDPASAVNTPNTGNAWANPTNAIAADGGVASFDNPGQGAATTDFLDVTDFPFNVGGDPTSLTVEVRRRTTEQAVDSIVTLILNGVAIGDDKAAVTFWPTSLAYKTYTWSQADLTAAGVTAAVLMDPGFGLRFQAAQGFLAGPAVAEVDHIRMSAEADAALSDVGVVVSSPDRFVVVRQGGY